jgi:hypothetical protein
VLGNPGDLLPPVAPRKGVDVDTADPERPVLEVDEAEEQGEKRGFA